MSTPPQNFDDEWENIVRRRTPMMWFGERMKKFVAYFIDVRVFWIGAGRQAFVEIFFMGVYTAKYRIMDETTSRCLADGRTITRLWPRQE